MSQAIDRLVNALIKAANTDEAYVNSLLGLAADTLKKQETFLEEKAKLVDKSIETMRFLTEEAKGSIQ